MACRRCASDSQSEFGAEINIHHPGLSGLNDADVMVFPKLVVCRNCGLVEFTLPESALSLLAARDEKRPSGIETKRIGDRSIVA